MRDFFGAWVGVLKQPPKDFWNATMEEFWAAFYAVVPPAPKEDRDKLMAMVKKFDRLPRLEGKGKDNHGRNR